MGGHVCVDMCGWTWVGVGGHLWVDMCVLLRACVQIFTQSDLEKAMNRVAEVTGNTANSWDVRVNAVSVLYLECYCQVTTGLFS